ncbi:transmembrane protein 270 isoform X2 [Apodemus sylvaticus]|uniref:transmembrane protein 270 isoform X2 n=1 Tax=Apodemus sylvaticus TaxID=10129 RepID=UPI0022443FDB|nr:transmembrane protein 270 isoform X2 [Apodemus sylvaticus]
MVSIKQVAISLFMTTVGLVAAGVSCVLPAWRVTFTDEETNPGARIWEGLWYLCQFDGNRWIQCSPYDTWLPVTQDLKVSRVIMVLCTTGTWLVLLLCLLVDRRIKCLRNMRIESKVMKVAGGMFLSAGFVMLISLSWATHNIIHGFFNPLFGYSQKAEMGVSLYLAWTSSLLLLLGGFLLLVNIPSRSDASRVTDVEEQLSSQLIQNRTHLYHFLLLKMAVFQHWVSGLSQEARGSGSDQAHVLPEVILTCALGLVLRAGLALLWVPMWLLLWGPRLTYRVGLCCTRTVRLALGHLCACEALGLSPATFRDLFLSCLHSLMLVALLLLLLTWKLLQKAHHFSLGWLPSQTLLQNSVLLEALALLRRLYLWVEHRTTLTSWNLAYLVTWTTCLVSHLLQAAFEHTAQLAQAQEAKPQETSGPLPQFLIPESSTTESGPLPPQPETPGE